MQTKTSYEIDKEYHEWLAVVYGKGMHGQKKRVNKAKKRISPSDLIHENPKIRSKAHAIYLYQRNVDGPKD